MAKTTWKYTLREIIIVIIGIMIILWRRLIKLRCAYSRNW